MAKITLPCLLLAFVFVVNFSNGSDVDPLIQFPLMLDSGKEAGDSEIKKEPVTLKFNISYFGSSYNTLYISNDGLISFDPHAEFYDIKWSEGISRLDFDWPFFAPFYHDGYVAITTSYTGKVFYRIIYADELDNYPRKENKDTIPYFSKYVQDAVVNSPPDFEAKVVVVVTWKGVTDSDTAGAICAEDECNPGLEHSATFQAVIVADNKHTFVLFNYENMAVPYQNGYQAGFNGGFGRGWFNVIPCHGACAVGLNRSRINDLPNLKGSDLVGRYILNIGDEEILRGGCLPNELKAGMLEVFPRVVGMFGGEKLEVSGKCHKANTQIFCKFGDASDSPVTEGTMTNDMKGFCEVPFLKARGPLLVQVSNDGETWTEQKYITVVLPDQIEEPVKVSDQEMLEWYKRDASRITLRWSPDRMSRNEDARVHVKLYGYRESTDKVELKLLETIGETVRNSEGVFYFNTEEFACTQNCKDFEMGLFEVSLDTVYHADASDRVALRYGPIPLGWYVNEKLTEDEGSDWSDKMCRRWDSMDKRDMNWLKQLPKCPCSIDQALADFGRWVADPSCDLSKGSKCHYHKEAIHCARSVQSTPDGAGNQCCYNSNKELIYSQLTYYGSTPDRSHAWGTFPYNIPDRVPVLSHWKHDVIPFYYCCLWNDFDHLCELYMDQRPTTDCALYEVPGVALVHGDPHISTFDGLTYNFGGKGDFWILRLGEISIQGRFDHRQGSWELGTKSWQPTALTSLTLQGLGQIIEIHPAPLNAIRNRGLDIKVDNSRYFFYTESSRWMDFMGQTIINNAKTMQNNPHNNFTILTNGIGINVVSENNLLHVTVALPPSMKVSEDETEGMGLLGMFDGKRENDLVSEGNSVTPPGSEPDKVYSFAMSWGVTRKEDTMFNFWKKPSEKTEYAPFLHYEDIPHDFSGAPTDAQIDSFCGSDDNCKWDYRITGSQKVALATKVEGERFAYTQGSAYKVENCGLPSVGHMAIMDSYNFSAGREVTITGCDEGHSFDGEIKFLCVLEFLQQAEDKDRDDYGRRIMDKNDKEHIIHWVPKPYTVCSESSEEPNLGMIIGIAVGAVVAFAIIVVIIVIVLKKRKGSSDKDSETPRRSDRVRSDRDFDEGTDEPMMSREKNPVYKPSATSRSKKPASSAV